MEGVSGRAEATQQDTETACRGLSVTPPATHPAPPAPMGPAGSLSTAGVQEKEKEKPHLGARTHDQEATSFEKMGSNGKKRAIGEERPPDPWHSLRSSEGRPPDQERPRHSLRSPEGGPSDRRGWAWQVASSAPESQSQRLSVTAPKQIKRTRTPTCSWPKPTRSLSLQSLRVGRGGIRGGKSGISSSHVGGI